jgi:hypothetical protein
VQRVFRGQKAFRQPCRYHVELSAATAILRHGLPNMMSKKVCKCKKKNLPTFHLLGRGRNHPEVRRCHPKKTGQQLQLLMKELPVSKPMKELSGEWWPAPSISQSAAASYCRSYGSEVTSAVNSHSQLCGASLNAAMQFQCVRRLNCALPCCSSIIREISHSRSRDVSRFTPTRIVVVVVGSFGTYTNRGGCPSHSKKPH